MKRAGARLRVVVTGLVAQHPCLGGVTWDYLQYPLGLAELGHDVYYLEDSGEWPYTLDGGPSGSEWVARDPTPNVSHLARVMQRFGLGERWAYRFPTEPRWFGLSETRRREVTNSADLILDVSGSLVDPDQHRGRGRLVYLDTDPVFTQIKLAVGKPEFRARVAAHDTHFSFGERVGALSFATGFRWRPTRQPVVLEEWRAGAATRDAYSTVMSWTSYPPLVFDGESFGQKDVEFRRFLDLPRRIAPRALEVAVGATRHLDWESAVGAASPHELLRRAGWRVADAYRVAADLDAYRDYVVSSRGEWSVQKHGYVRGQPGWFSCRSACYLAAGRPVVVQDTGLAGLLPLGEGILAFTDPEQAAAALREVDANYPRHAAAARALAGEYFDSRRVLAALLEEALASDA